MTITPTNEKAVESDGAGLLPEEVNGNPPKRLGTITDNKNSSNEAIYEIATGDDATADNVNFNIEDNTLYYIGANSGDFETAGVKKSFTLKIERYNSKADADGNGNPQILQYIVNLKDLEEVLTITPASGVTYFSVENGEAFLDENTDGSTEKLLGTIIDNIVTSAVISYKLADATSSNDNGNFRIDTATDQIYYTGPALDFESLTDKKQLTLDIIRTLNGNAATEQTLQRTINLKNLNDSDPVLTAEGGTIDGEKLQLFWDISGTVTTGDNDFTLAFEDMPLASNALIVEFTNTGPDGNVHTSNTPALSVTYQDPEDTTSNIEKVTIHYKHLVDRATLVTNLETAFKDSANGLSNYFASITGDNTTFVLGEQTRTITSSTPPTLKVASGTTGIIADFSSTDPDGDLNDFAYSLSDTVDNSGDSTLFNINADGELSFKTAPSYDSGTPANNDHKITITVSDGTNSDTYDLLVQVIE